MGQILQRIVFPGVAGDEGHVKPGALIQRRFPDLSELPPEISLLVLSKLNATDLCLAACVWDKLGNDEVLWQRYMLSLLFINCIIATKPCQKLLLNDIF